MIVGINSTLAASSDVLRTKCELCAKHTPPKARSEALQCLAESKPMTATATQTRQTLIRLAMKRQRAGSGSSDAFLGERTMRMEFPDLNGVLAGVQWAVVGAAATRRYMPERATNDLDILVSAEDAETVRGKLRQAGAQYMAELSIGGSSWRLADGFPVDVIEGREGWTFAAIAEAQTNRGDDNLPALPLSYLVLMKFAASRVQDLADISRMLGGATDAQLNTVRDVFARWSSNDTDDLESLILLGQLEHKPQSFESKRKSE